ncbi:MAG: dihydrofolate reductase [Parcubacteria group bacterium]|nr:dihydrofolate reductase [Parcubacteria group bacterium]
MSDLNLSLIVAMTAKEQVIGFKNTIPWKIPSDMLRFKKITTEIGTVLMGRKTWESIPQKYRPLSDRHSIVLSRSGSVPQSKSVQVVASVEEALAAIAQQGGHCCIAGGEELYRLFLPRVRTLYTTIIDAVIEGDAHFPFVNQSDWNASCAIRNMRSQGDQYRTSYFEYHKTVR